jgi:HD-like signal output (HDOD) protein/prolyl-tRNA editing enzyme YbaK/EbsC (Cys-tRNA(Pro) deacylase)
VTVPASIETLLKKHNVSYTLANLSSSQLMSANVIQEENVHSIRQHNQEQTAHAHLLHSPSQQKLLAITPSQTILDLEAIKEALGEPYTPVLGNVLKTFVKGLGLESMAAMPKLGNLPTIVDRQLLNTDKLLLNVGIKNQHIEIDGDSFQKLLESTIVKDIAVPLSVLNMATPSTKDVEQITHSVEQFTELRVKQRLEETLELPALPAIAQQIIKLRVNPNADVSDLCNIIELDPSLAAQVVSWASSPYYSAPGTIKSIHDAIVRVLGFDMVLSLALGLALGNTLKLPTHRPEGCVSYWEQAVYVASCTEAIISCMPRECRPSYGCSYLSGLLHNFGYLISAEVFSSQFKTICQHIDANPHTSPQIVEKHIIGVTRDQLAAWLMNYWHMPEEVCKALRYQSEPEYQGEHAEYAALIYLTKKLLNEKGIRTGVSDDPINDSLFSRFKLNREEVLEAIDIMLESNELLESMAQKMRG